MRQRISWEPDLFTTSLVYELPLRQRTMTVELLKALLANLMAAGAAASDNGKDDQETDND